MVEANVVMHLRKTHQKITQIMQKKVDEYGLTFGLLHIVMLIDKNPDANQKELSKEMKFTQGAMSSSIKRLIKLNMIEQIPLEEDMRYNKLVITETGRKMINDYKEHVSIKYKDMFFGFSHDELVEFNVFLTRLNENLDQINK